MTAANTQKSNALPAAAPPPSEMVYCGHASEGAAGAMSLERVGCGNPHQISGVVYVPRK